MSNNRKLAELTAYQASVEAIIERADTRDRLSFPEIRALDRLCKDALERAFPELPHLAENWYVNENKGASSHDDVHREFVKKRQILTVAINMLRSDDQGHGEKPISMYGITKEYSKIAETVRQFLSDRKRECQDYDRNVFIMTRFQKGNKQLEEINKSIRGALKARGFVGHRADDRVYPNDRNLWDNVCTYMFGCKLGIAVLEDVDIKEFNPNVALEYGFMRAIGKPTLLLKERRFQQLRADILGTIWTEFDIFDIQNSIVDAINAWLEDVGT